MNPALARALRQLLETQTNAALGTLHQGEPFVSMVPFALLPGGAAFVIHVSGLASHTQDMRESPKVSLMIMATPTPDIPPQALPRATVQGEARPLAQTDPAHAAAKAAYLARFPQSVPMFALPDFALFVIEPKTIRLVAGFAQATSLTPNQLAEVFGEIR